MRHHRRLVRASAVAVALASGALVLGACGSSGDSSTSTGASTGAATTSASTAASTTAAASPAVEAARAEVEKYSQARPTSA